MIFSLILYTCLTTGGDCRVEQITYEKMTLGNCFMAFRDEVPKYMAAHPKRKFVGAKCSDRPEKFIKANEA